jgi:hypothetical protein
VHSLTSIDSQSKTKGDGTSQLLNKAGLALAVIAYLGAWRGSVYWSTQNDLPVVSYGLLILVAAGLLDSLIHSLGQTVIGFAFHMHLRSIAVGPFQIQIREGKWTFKFNLGAMLNYGGTAGMVPTTAKTPTKYQIAMIAAGPVANFYSGFIAMAIAYALAISTSDSLNRNYAYPCALFGFYSLISCAINLIPLRSGDNYSDGAQILQLLRGGPFADLHRASALVASTLVTPLQPKDYDLPTLERASAGVNQEMRGLLLRFWIYDYYLDAGQLAEAGKALELAEQFSKELAEDLPAEHHTLFVFGHAYVRRDAAAARQWWVRLQDKNPTQLDADYYRAESALHWIEGHLEEATASLTKSNELAHELPAAGAYQFGRNCSALLRQAIESAPSPAKDAPLPPVVSPATEVQAPQKAAVTPKLVAEPVAKQQAAVPQTPVPVEKPLAAVPAVDTPIARAAQEGSAETPARESVVAAPSATPAPKTPLLEGVPVLDESGYQWTFLKDVVAPQPAEAAAVPE